MASPSWPIRYWTVLLWGWKLYSPLKYQEQLNKWHRVIWQRMLGGKRRLSYPVFLLSEFGYLLLEHQCLLFVVWLDMSEMLHFGTCSEMFRKLFHEFGYQRELLQYYRLTKTIFFLPPERLQWQSKETSLFYSSHFSVTQFSLFQRSISFCSETWLRAEGRSARSYICCWRQWTGSPDAHCQLLSSAAEYGRCGGHILHLHYEIREDYLSEIRWLCVLQVPLTQWKQRKCLMWRPCLWGI